MRKDSPIIVERVDFDNGWSITYSSGSGRRCFIEIADGDSGITISRKFLQFSREIQLAEYPFGVPIG
jgi:hypothetical protein